MPSFVHLLFLLILITVIGSSCQKNKTSQQTKSDATVDLLKIDPFNVPIDEVERMVWQKPNQLLDRFGDLSDRVVADIGSGTGYFTFRLALRAKRVVAIDIDTSMLSLIDDFKVNLDSLTALRIETRLTVPEDPGIKKNEMDDVLMVNTIGYITNKEDYLKRIFDRLKVKGRLVIIDFKMKRLPSDIAPSREHRAQIWDVENLLEQTGFNLIVTDDMSLDYQYIIVATKTK